MIVVRQCIACLAGLIALIALAGTIDNVRWMQTWGGTEHMRPTTAVMMLVGCLQMVVMAHPRKHGSARHYVIVGCGAFNSGIIVANLTWVHITHTGQYEALPSIGTHIAFALLAVASWLRGMIGNAEWAIGASRLAGVVATVALFGYIIDAPAIYWAWDGWTGMAFPTIVGLLLLSIAANGREDVVA